MTVFDKQLQGTPATVSQPSHAPDAVNDALAHGLSGTLFQLSLTGKHQATLARQPLTGIMF